MQSVRLKPLQFRESKTSKYGYVKDIVYSRKLITVRDLKLRRIYYFFAKVAGSIPNEVIGFFNWRIPSSHIMALGSTRPLTEISTRDLPGGKGRPALKTDNLTAMCELIV
jgi:hypothetical protein